VAGPTLRLGPPPSLRTKDNRGRPVSAAPPILLVWTIQPAPTELRSKMQEVTCEARARHSPHAPAFKAFLGQRAHSLAWKLASACFLSLFGNAYVQPMAAKSHTRN
jgi:hypothetical protein